MKGLQKTTASQGINDLRAESHTWNLPIHHSTTTFGNKTSFIGCF